MKQFLFLGLFVSLLPSCTSTYKIPMARMMSSESEGASKVSLQSGFHEFHEVTLTRNISQTPVNSSSHPVDPVSSFGLSGSFGVFERLDLGMDFEWGVAPMVFAKYQLLGESRRKAQAGNFSFSLFSGLGQESTSSASDPFVFGQTPGKVDRDASSLIEAGLLLGYRVNPHAVFAVGSSLFWQTISGKQTLGNSSIPSTFSDHARYSEVHAAGTFTTSENSGQSFFITPTIQWGCTQSFGNRSYLVAGQLDFGTQF